MLDRRSIVEPEGLGFMVEIAGKCSTERRVRRQPEKRSGGSFTSAVTSNTRTSSMVDQAAIDAVASRLDSDPCWNPCTQPKIAIAQTGVTSMAIRTASPTTSRSYRQQLRMTIRVAMARRRLLVELAACAVLPAALFFDPPAQRSTIMSITYSCDGALTAAGLLVAGIATAGMAVFGVVCIALIRWLATALVHSITRHERSVGWTGLPRGPILAGKRIERTGQGQPERSGTVGLSLGPSNCQ